MEASQSQPVTATASPATSDAQPSVPQDRPFYAIDAYGEVQHVEWIGEQGGPFGPYVGVLDSDGECFPVSDILGWSDDEAEAEALAGQWHGDGDDGRWLACALGVLGPNVNNPRDCPAAIMPRWLAQMVPGFFDRQKPEDALAWGERFYEQLARLGGKVPFSVVHDWQANTVCVMAIETATKHEKPTDVHERVQALHLKHLAGGAAPRDEWHEALRPAYRQTYLSAYYADANADAYAYAWKRLADGMVEALSRVPAEAP